MADEAQVTENLVTSQAPEQASEAPVQTENMVPQSQVNHMLGKVRTETANKAYEKGRADALAESQKQPSTADQSREISPEHIEKVVAEVTERKAREFAANKVATDFMRKLDAGKEKYPDIEAKAAKLRLHQAPEIVDWVNSLDNTADMINEMSENPTKYSSVLRLARDGFPELAQEELSKLSDSIKKNQDAVKNAKSVPEPLSRIKPSAAATDNGKPTIKDLRRQSWMKA